MSEDRFKSIEKAVDLHGQKIDRLVEGFAVLTDQNKNITRLIERQDAIEDRVSKLETFKTEQQTRRESSQWLLTKLLPASLTLGAAALAGIKLYIG